MASVKEQDDILKKEILERHKNGQSYDVIAVELRTNKAKISRVVTEQKRRETEVLDMVKRAETKAMKHAMKRETRSETKNETSETKTETTMKQQVKPETTSETQQKEIDLLKQQLNFQNNLKTNLPNVTRKKVKQEVKRLKPLVPTERQLQDLYNEIVVFIYNSDGEKVSLSELKELERGIENHKYLSAIYAEEMGLDEDEFEDVMALQAFVDEDLKEMLEEKQKIVKFLVSASILKDLDDLCDADEEDEDEEDDEDYDEDDDDEDEEEDEDEDE